MDMELKKSIGDLGTAFEQFKSANDARLEQIEKRGVANPETLETIAKIEAKLSELDEVRNKMDDIEAKSNRLNAGGATERDTLLAEHKAGFEQFFRKGHDNGLTDLEVKALNIGTPTDGGHAVPEDLDRMIHDLLIDVSPMRSVANVVQVGTSDYKKLVNTRGAASGWVGETAARPETTSPNLEQIAPPIGEVYSNLFATQHMLDDAFFNVEEFISSELATEFGRAEGAAFINGTGTNQPKGFLTETVSTDVDGTRAFGELQYIPTGVAGDFAAAPDGGDKLIDITMSLKQGHRRGAQWLMAKLVLGDVRKLKDSDGQYLWKPGLEEGVASTLLGYGVTEMEDMPARAADSLSIAFGNFNAGYTIVDRMGTRMLRDPYTNKPYVTFYVTKRVGGKIIDSEAIKLLKFGIA